MPNSDSGFTYRGRIKISRADMLLFKKGKKKCTIRMGRASVATPEILLSDGSESIKVRILRVENQHRFDGLTQEHAKDEGFNDLEELIRDLRKYYPRAVGADPITIIYFEPCEPIPREALLFE